MIEVKHFLFKICCQKTDSFTLMYHKVILMSTKVCLKRFLGPRIDFVSKGPQTNSSEKVVAKCFHFGHRKQGIKSVLPQTRIRI